MQRPFFRDTAGRDYSVSSVSFDKNSGRGSYLAVHPVLDQLGRGWLFLLNRAPLSVSIEKAGPDEQSGQNRYEFIIT